MSNRRTLSLLTFAAIGSASAAIVIVACGSDDTNGAGGSNDGGITIDVIINSDGSKPKDSGGGADACSSEGFGESCEASADCTCSGVCAAQKCVNPPACGDAILTWQGPTSNVDGTCITDLAGFTLNWWNDDGGSPSDNSFDAGLSCVDGPALACGDAGMTAIQLDCAYRLMGLGNATWDFTASAYTDGGLTSNPSVEAQKTITCN